MHSNNDTIKDLPVQCKWLRRTPSEELICTAADQSLQLKHSTTVGNVHHG